MAYEQKDNSGSVFSNDKGDNQNRPDRKGKAMVSGKMYWVSIWDKKTQDGKVWLSMSFNPMDDAAAAKQSEPKPVKLADEEPFGDD